MLVEEIIAEGYKSVWGRGPKGVVRRYRCTDGKKKGRVVAKPSTCTTSVSQSKSHALKRTRWTKGAAQDAKRKLRLDHPTSRRLIRLNKSIKPKKRKKIRR